jgi:hypothetical protein
MPKALWLIAALVLTPASSVRFDADLHVECGADFAVFDRFEPSGRVLNVVPWTATGQLRVAGSVAMPDGQPHAWVIHESLIVVRLWNDFHVYSVDNGFQPRLIHSARIDDERSNVGGTVAIELTGSSLRVHGTERTIVVDLDACADACTQPVEPVSNPTSLTDLPRSCRVAREGRLFALTVADTPGDGAVYHDLFLTRRRTDPTGMLVREAFAPGSILYLGTRVETGGAP